MIVPPMQSDSRTREDQRETKASVPPRLDMAKIDMRSWSIDIARMKYLRTRRDGINVYSAS